MPKSKNVFDYDLIVIGSGSGGGVAAHIAAKKGKKVAIFEKHRVLGGECPNWACVPTKALLYAAETYHTAKTASQYGISIQNISVNYPRVKAWKDLVVKRTGTEHGDESFADSGIAVYHENARFIDKDTITAGGKRFRARKFLIASGTTNFIPPITGLLDTGFLTFFDAIDLTKAPRSIFIIGGGAIGVEFAHLFNRFDVKVTLLEVAAQLLGREEPEAAELTKAVLENRGVRIITGGTIFSVKKNGNKKIISYSDGKTASTLMVDEILVAAGKKPNVDLGLENAGVKYTPRGITTNRFMQTSKKHIYAAGDVVGPYQFTHTASYQSRLAGHNMFSRDKNKVAVDYSAIPRCIFFSPEIASVGLTELEVQRAGIATRVGRAPISVIGRSNTENQSTGFVKIIANKKGQILGATIVAPRAGEMIHELGLAIRMKTTVEQVASTIHAFPTWSEAIRVAAVGM
ncbi:NAD(P)/FAD-dependent oxidoreductase [Candidatus Saccharibacteria bacterium]|nr:NAD(P)/FAD-dependent oxidoreductase [Candidatus Saccharibacteria bacterium]